MSSAGAPLVHVCVGDAAGPAGLQVVTALAQECEFLIAGGGIADVDGARRVLDAGAGAVAVATAAMKDASLCGDMQRALRGGG